MGSNEEERIYIEELATILDRKPHSIRQWLKDLPRELRPKREGGRKKIYWLPDQIEGMKRYAQEKSQRRGWQHAA